MDASLMRTDVRLHEETGGFYVVRGEWQYVPPERMMPTEEVLNGVLVPLYILPNVPSKFWDYDHAHFEIHDPRLMGNDRRALRYCAGQDIPRPVHERKNDAYDAVEIPTDSSQIFQAVLLGAAGYITHYALDLSEDKPQIGVLNDAMRRDANRYHLVRMERGTKWKVGLYMATYAVKHGIEAIKDTVEVEQFLDAGNNQEVRKKASFAIMRLAVRAVVDPIEGTYEVARRKGRIRQPESTATRFLTRYFEAHQPDYAETISEQLQAVG